MRKSFLVGLIALLAAGVGGYFGFTLYVGYQARQQVDAFFLNLKAAGIEGSSGKVEFDAFDGRLDIDDLVFSVAGQGTLKIASFTAEGLSQTAPNRMSAKRIDFHGVSFAGPLPFSPGVEGRYDAPLIELTGVDGPTEVVASGPDPAQLVLALIEETTITKIAIPGATGSTRAGTGAYLVETDISHGAVTVETLDKGRIAALTLEPSSFRIAGAGTDAGAGRIGRVTASGVDLAGGLILLDPKRRPAETGYRTLYGMITVDGYEVSTDNGLHQSWKTMELRDIALKPSAVPVENLLATAQRVQLQVGRGEPAATDDTAELLRGVADIYDAMRLGSATLTGLETTQPDGSKAQLATMKVGALDAGVLSQITLEGFTGTDGPDKPASFERLTLGGLRPGAMMRMAADSVDDPDATGDIGFLMRGFGLLGRFELLNAKATMTKGKDPATIDKLQLAWTASEGALPTQFSATLRAAGPTDALDTGQPAAQVLPEGIARASIALDLGAQWNAGEQSVTVTPVYLEISDAFSLNAGAVFTDVDSSIFSDEPEGVTAAALAANLASLEVTLVDSGLYQQKLDEAAQQQGIPAETLRQLFAGFAELLLGQTVSERPELDPAVQALVAFLQKPMGTIALRVTPRGDALTVLTIMQALQDDPTSLIDEVEVEVIDTP
ncbi:hypothetical protein [Ancylobacter sp. G4_0304]|uniref:hypothetical protein n=1 Tax=Ancylobacter sp. G4_0304 TaxID=3114289 RepID=UPI0039C6CCD7